MDLTKFREDFPVLSKGITYLDSACMSLKPIQVIDAINRYYNEFPACAGRSAHSLGQAVTDEVEKTRKTLSDFFNTKKAEKIVFTRNTTESINLVASSFKLERDDAVVITDKEHNSNLIPWLKLREEKGIEVKIITSNEDNTFSMENFNNTLTKNVKLVSLVHISNLDGTTIPAKEVIKISHDHNIPVLLDGAQSAPHKEINVKKLDVDYFACSGHKMLGPTGTGMLYARDYFENLNPFIVGGDTVENSTYNNFSLLKPPEKFEAGLQDYAGILGWRAAVEYLKKAGMANIQRHELELNKTLSEALKDLEELVLIGPKDPGKRAGIFNFYIKGVDYHELALLLDNNAKVMIRSGQHCVHSWFNSRGIKGSDRVSLYLYNNKEDIEKFVEELKNALEILK